MPRFSKNCVMLLALPKFSRNLRGGVTHGKSICMAAVSQCCPSTLLPAVVAWVLQRSHRKPSCGRHTSHAPCLSTNKQLVPAMCTTPKM